MIEAKDIKPIVTWGTSPAEAMDIDGIIPENADAKALAYMNLSVGT